jgi:glycosyltransferase involved in cell wall biosynthesis
VPLHVVRSYLAPLGLALAERLDAPWATLDLDDDDETLLRELGDDAEAAAYGRLIATFGPSYAWCALASDEEAQALAARTGLLCHAVPNAVALPRVSRPDPALDDGPIGILLVGNLTYIPNIEAAESLVRRVVPALRRLTDRPVTATLVGRFAPGGSVEALAREDGVTLTGYVSDLDRYYAAASVAVVPLSSGAGTRIKLLEAFAHRVPVVCSSAARAGLAAIHERHLLVADSARQQARAVARLVEDAKLRAALVDEAAALVATDYSIDVVGRRLRELMPAA